MSTPITVKTQIQALINNANAKTGNNDTDLTTAVNSLIDGYGGGSHEEDYITYASIIQFNNLNYFGKSEIFIHLKYVKRIGSMFQQNTEKNNTVEHITLKTEQKLEYANAIFYALSAYVDEYLKHITLHIDTSEVLNMSTIFAGLRALEVIDGDPLDFSSATNVNNVFGDCVSLKEVRFKINSIKISFQIHYPNNLSDASIQSLIDGLADLTGATSQTLTLHKDVKAKLTEEQISTITNKNWTLA